MSVSLESVCQVCLLAVMLALPDPAQDPGKDEPAVESLARAGQATLKRLETEAASWTATTQLGGGTRVVVETVGTPTQRRTILRIEAQSRSSELLRIVVRNGVWYATEGRKAGKYRPYEAPFDFPTAYLFLTLSDPQCIVEAQRAALGEYQGTSDGIATYRAPLAEPTRRQIQNMLGEYDQMKQRNPDQAAKPDMAKPFERLRDLLENGTPTKIEVATGLIVQFGTAERQIEIHDFRWLDRLPPDEFKVEGKQWDDSTEDPTECGTSELLMISHSGMWQPGMKSHDTEGGLFDLRTGRYRRLPFKGATALPGCFMRDRTRVVVSGLDASIGAMGLYEVDLKSGENRRLGGDLLANGFSLMPALSADGKTLAVLHKRATGGILDSEVCLVDVETGAARALGKPHDMAYLSWLPNGKGLILLVRESTDPSDVTAPRTDTIARMDMNGGIEKVREGTSPVLMGDGKTILFQDSKSRTWHTCDLDGGHAKQFADGLERYGDPSPAPDGKRMIMMHFRSGKAPEPMILPIGESKGIPATTARGLWASPAWR